MGTGTVVDATLIGAPSSTKNAEKARDPERRAYGDSAYASQKALIESKASQAQGSTNQRVRKDDEGREVERSKNRNKSKVRARIEHVFAVVKRL